MLSLVRRPHFADPHKVEKCLKRKEVIYVRVVFASQFGLLFLLLTVIIASHKLRLAIFVIVNEVLLTNHIVMFPNAVVEVLTLEFADSALNHGLLSFVQLELDLLEMFFLCKRLHFTKRVLDTLD